MSSEVEPLTSEIGLASEETAIRLLYLLKCEFMETKDILIG